MTCWFEALILRFDMYSYMYEPGAKDHPISHTLRANALQAEKFFPPWTGMHGFDKAIGISVPTTANPLHSSAIIRRPDLR